MANSIFDTPDWAWTSAEGSSKFFQHSDDKKSEANTELDDTSSFASRIHNATLMDVEAIKPHDNKESEAIDVKGFEKKWQEIFQSAIVVDSNIWMNQECDFFFTLLEKTLVKFKAKIKISPVQFDEIVNLKDLPYKDPKSKQARCALKRIEYFQRESLVDLSSIKVQTNKKAYADPAIIKSLTAYAKDYKEMLLVTNDTELRIRAVQVVNEKSSSKVIALSGKELEKELSFYHNSL